MTEQELKEIEDRANAATPGPWGSMWHARLVFNDFGIITNDCDSNDSNFIAHAREDVPKLIAEVKRLQNLNKELSWRISGLEK